MIGATATGRGRRDGFILVAVLGVMALLAALVGGSALLVRAAFDGARANADELALDALVRAGLDLAGHQLYGLKLPPELIEGQEIRLDSGTVRLSLTDEAGRIDLNGADPALLAAACEAAACTGLRPLDFAAKALAWRGRHDPPPGTPEPTDPRLRRRKEGFRSVEELRVLPGLSATDLAALARVVTVANPSGKVNLMSAPSAIVLALPEMTESLAAQVLALRRVPGPASAQQISRLLPRQQGLVTTRGGPSYRVRIEARRGSGAARLAEAVITRAPGKLAPFFIVEWSG